MACPRFAAGASTAERVEMSVRSRIVKRELGQSEVSVDKGTEE